MKVLLGSILMAAAALTASAQQPPTTAKAVTEVLASSEKVVKGAPFSAEAVSESLQILADGNRIVRSSSNRMFRDTAGRFRREGIANPAATLGAYFELQPTILILDPVNGFKYYVNSDSKTIRKFTLTLRNGIKTATGTTAPKAEGHGTAAGEYADAARKLRTEINERQREVYATAGAHARNAELGPIKPLDGQLTVGGTLGAGVLYSAGVGYETSTKTEDLGIQTMQGVPAEGMRTTTTIPMGAIGNERPIDIVYERWYSKDLQLIVSSKHSDPRFGDQIYRLTNIVRTEPDTSLFTVPADFKVVFEPARGFSWPSAPPKVKPTTPGAPSPVPAPEIPPGALKIII